MQIHPLTPARWDDFVALFGARGACGGCWCMSWRLTKSAFEAGKGEANMRAMRALVDAGQPLGILGYSKGQPIAWCSVAPRETYPRLAAARTLEPIDDQPVWSIVCLFVAKEHRRSGVSVEMLKAAAKYVRANGGRIAEGYPVEPAQELPAPFAWVGLVSAFRKAGFVEVARPSKGRAIMRRLTT